MRKPPVVNKGPIVQPCETCGNKNAPWGFHRRRYCTAHKAHGEVLMQATSDGLTAASIPALPVTPMQGKLL